MKKMIKQMAAAMCGLLLAASAPAVLGDDAAARFNGGPYDGYDRIVQTVTAAGVKHTPLLKNVTDDLVVFDDDFELTKVPAAGTLNFPATPLLGTWALATSYGIYTQGVANTARSASGAILAAEGNHFLMMHTFTASTGRAMTGKGVVANSGAGDTVEATIAFYLVAGSKAALFYLYGGAAQADLLAAFNINGTGGGGLTNYTLASHNGAGWQQTSLSFSPDRWNRMKVVHTNGTKTWAVSFNGGAAITVNGYQDATGFLLNAIYFNQTAPSTVYFDAVVPPPAGTLIRIH